MKPQYKPAPLDADRSVWIVIIKWGGGPTMVFGVCTTEARAKVVAKDAKAAAYLHERWATCGFDVHVERQVLDDHPHDWKGDQE